MKKTVEVEAYCSACAKVTTHVATFTGQFLKDRACQECGSVTRSPRGTLLRAYADDLLDRALSKPYRLRQEWKKGHMDVIHSLPSRLIARPLREARSLADLLSEEQAGKPDSPTDDKPPEKPSGESDTSS